jgi:hypothetical protein
MFTDPQAIANYWKRLKGAVPKEDANKLLSTLHQTNKSRSIPISQPGSLLEAAGNIAETITDTSNKPTIRTNTVLPNELMHFHTKKQVIV